MINQEQIYSYFPPILRDNPAHRKYLIKEYLLLLILDHLSTTSYVRKLVFIGGTNLRLVKGIDRFSEDIDFDIKNLSHDEFLSMTNGVISFLKRYGLNVEARDKQSEKLSAFRRSLYFPQLLFDLGLSGHREERFLLKVEAEDQGVKYNPMMANIRGCGFFFQFPVPPDPVLCAMKISALLSRAKGRDFYDTIFLMSQTQPDYTFLKERTGISNPAELTAAFLDSISRVNLSQKAKDFEHLLFDSKNSKRIESFPEFVASM